MISDKLRKFLSRSTIVKKSGTHIFVLPNFILADLISEMESKHDEVLWFLKAEVIRRSKLKLKVRKSRVQHQD